MDTILRARMVKRVAGWEECAMLLRLKVVAALQSEDPLSRACANAILHFQQTLSTDGLGETDIDEAWRAYFIDQISGFAVTGEGRHGYIDAQTVAWLVGGLRDHLGLLVPPAVDVMIAAIQKADDVPPTLPQLAFLAICQRIDIAGRAEEADVRQLETALFFSTRTRTWVSRDEAVRLMTLSSRISTARNHPSWNTFYASAIGNYLLARADTVLHRGLFSSALQSSCAPSTGDENWLVHQVSRTEAANPAERALIDFLHARLPGFAEAMVASAA